MIEEVIKKLNFLVKEYSLLSILLVYMCAVVTSILLNSYSKRMVNTGSLEVPIMNSAISSNESVVVYISGAVESPGVYEVSSGSRLADAVEKAKGFSTDANKQWVLKNLNLAQKVEDSSKYYIPFIWDIEYLDVQESSISTLENYESVSFDKVEESKKDNNLININSASIDELKELSGIGDVYANKIIDNRPYTSLADFSSNSGLSESLISKIQNLITF